MSTAVIKTPVMELVNLCKVGRSAYLEAIQRRDEMQAAMVRADGLLQAIDAARTEQVAAVLLRSVELEPLLLAVMVVLVRHLQFQGHLLLMLVVAAVL